MQGLMRFILSQTFKNPVKMLYGNFISSVQWKPLIFGRDPRLGSTVVDDEIQDWDMLLSKLLPIASKQQNKKIAVNAIKCYIADSYTVRL